jgi:polysaccharide deacetylase family protein (PEP-CTERM system associated)
MEHANSTTTHFFTVDVEEYFQVRALESVVRRDDWLSYPSRVAQSIHELLETLDRHNVRGTFFTLGWVAERCPEVVRAIVAEGHEVASHGFWHERVTALGRDSFCEDIRRSKEALEHVTGVEVLGYRAPSFSIVPGCEWAFDALIEHGYLYDSSLFPIIRRGYGYPAALRVPHVIKRSGGDLAEFPLATTNIFNYPVPAAGGGYLRQLPFGLIRRAFREATERGESATFYIHPWEIDDGQPRLPVSTLNRIRQYRGLSTTLSRIDRLLGEFRFGTIASHLQRLRARHSELLTEGAA